MINKRILRKIDIPYPENLSELFKDMDEKDAVINFNVVTAERRKLLVVDIFFKNGRHIRSFIHKTSKSFDYCNLINDKYWNRTRILNVKVENQDRYNVLMEQYYFDICSSKKFLNKKCASEYLGTEDNGKTILYAINVAEQLILEKKYKAEPKNKTAAKIANKVEVAELTPTQAKWLKEKASTLRNKKTWAYFITKVDGAVVLRHFCCEYNKKSGQYDYYEPLRTVFYPDKTYGIYQHLVNNFTGITDWYNGASYCVWPYFQKGFIYKGNLKKVLSDTFFKYSGLDALNDKMRVDRYLKGYLVYSQFEFLIKDGFLKLVDDLASSPSYYSKVNTKATNTAEFLKIPKHYLSFLKGKNYGFSVVPFLQELKKLNYSDEIISDLLEMYSGNGFACREFLELATLRPTMKKLINYLKKQSILLDKSIGSVTNLFVDYIGFCKKLNYDINNRGVLFPKDIHRAHDAASEAIIVKKNAKLAKEYEVIRKKLDSINNMVIGEYIFTIPYSIKDFIRQGEALNQCVGKGNYYQNMAHQCGLIVFVNKVSEPDIPCFTLEIRDGANVQFRGKNNCSATKDAELAVKHYLRQINRVLIFEKNHIIVDEEKAKKLFAA